MYDWYKTYILAIWPHPDDVEIGAWWLLYQSSCRGKSCVIVDMTCSHLSTRGTPDTRLEESYRSASILWVSRVNLGLDDLSLSGSNDYKLLIAHYIRLYRPEIVLFPYSVDRHPDHEATSQIVKHALFVSWLSKIEIDWLSPHRPRVAAMYHIWWDTPVDIVIPLTQHDYDIKSQAFWSYDTQQETNRWAKEYFDSRSVVLWWKIWACYGEAYVLYEWSLGLQSFDSIITRQL